jgi:hypothetical protein
MGWRYLGCPIDLDALARFQLWIPIGSTQNRDFIQLLGLFM